MWLCKLCDSMLSTRYELLKHFRLRHSCTHRYPCVYLDCPCTFLSWKKLLSHTYRRHSELETGDAQSTTFSCQMCGCIHTLHPSHSHEHNIYCAQRENLQINIQLASRMSCIDFGGQSLGHTAYQSILFIFQDIGSGEAEADIAEDHRHLHSPSGGSWSWWSRWWALCRCRCYLGRRGSPTQSAECQPCMRDALWTDLCTQPELSKKPQVYIRGVPENPDGLGFNPAFTKSTSTETQNAQVTWLGRLHLRVWLCLSTLSVLFGSVGCWFG